MTRTRSNTLDNSRRRSNTFHNRDLQRSSSAPDISTSSLSDDTVENSPNLPFGDDSEPSPQTDNQSPHPLAPQIISRERSTDELSRIQGTTENIDAVASEMFRQQNAPFANVVVRETTLRQRRPISSESEDLIEARRKFNELKKTLSKGMYIGLAIEAIDSAVVGGLNTALGKTPGAISNFSIGVMKGIRAFLLKTALETQDADSKKQYNQAIAIIRDIEAVLAVSVGIYTNAQITTQIRNAIKILRSIIKSYNAFDSSDRTTLNSIGDSIAGMLNMTESALLAYENLPKIGFSSQENVAPGFNSITAISKALRGTMATILGIKDTDLILKEKVA